MVLLLNQIYSGELESLIPESEKNNTPAKPTIKEMASCYHITVYKKIYRELHKDAAGNWR